MAHSIHSGRNHVGVKPFIRRVPWRYALILLPLVGVAAVGVVGWMVLRDTVRQARVEEQRRGMERAEILLEQAQRLLAAQRQERTRDREAAQARLDQRVTALAGDAQVFLHAALIERRSHLMRERNDRLEKRVHAFREAATLLAGAAHAQEIHNRELRKEMEAILALAPAPDAPRPGSAPPTADTPRTSSTPDTSSESDAVIRLPARILKGMRQRLHPEASEQGDTLSHLAKTIDPLLRGVPDDPASDPAWAEALLRHCGLDLVTLLPEGGGLTVSEVGGRVLLHLGAEEVPAEALVAESTRTLLFEGEAAQVNWTITLRLVDGGAPRAPTPEEMALHLSEQLRFDKGSMTVDAFFVDEGGTVQAVFPDPERVGMPMRHPASVWTEEPMRGRMVWYEQRACQMPHGWALGVRVTMPDALDADRIMATLRGQPAYAVGWITMVLGACLLLAGVVYMVWPGQGAGAGAGRRLVHGGGGGGMRGPVLVADLDAGNGPVVPVPGSLHRLQTENRGHARGGSLILEHARSPVLRDLARKVRTPEGTATRISAAFVRARPKKADAQGKTGGRHV